VIVNIVAMVSMLATIIVGLVAHVKMVQMHRDMIDKQHQLIELANVDRIRLLDRMKSKAAHPEIKKEERPPGPVFAGTGNRRLQP